MCPICCLPWPCYTSPGSRQHFAGTSRQPIIGLIRTLYSLTGSFACAPGLACMATGSILKLALRSALGGCGMTSGWPMKVPALQGQGAPDMTHHANIPVEKLPSRHGCLLRPGVVW